MSGMARLLDHPAAMKLSLALVHFLWQGVALALLALVGLALVRRARPAVRYLVLISVLLAMALAPVLTYLHLTYGAGWLNLVTPRVTERTVIVVKGDVYRGSVRLSPEGAPLPVAAGLIPSAAPERFSAEWWRARASWVSAAWLIGVLLLSSRLLMGWLAAERARRHHAEPVGGRWQAALATLAERMRVARPVQLLSSAAAGVPATIGWLRPVILFPASALSGLPPDQVEALIAHELAHIRRHDYLVNIVQSAVETLLFYHPAVWWLSRRIRVEREHCCDDLAAQACGDTLSYARALADMEALRADLPGLAVAASGGSLVARIRRLAQPPTRGQQPGLSWASALVVTAAAVALALALQMTSTPSLAEQAARDYSDRVWVDGEWDPGPIPIEGTLFVSGFCYEEGGSKTYSYTLEGDTSNAVLWPVSFVDPDLSPVSDEVVYDDVDGSEWPVSQASVYRANWDGSEAVNLTELAGVGGVNCTPTWSPDGTMIAFQHSEPEPGQLPCHAGFLTWVMNADGTDPRSLPDEQGRGRFPRWLPDGEHLIWETYDGAAIADLSGRRQSYLPGAGGISDASPDGRYIVTSASEGGELDGEPGEWRQLLLMSADGQECEVLVAQFISYAEADAHYNGPAGEGRTKDDPYGPIWESGPVFPKWSPRGDYIAFLGAIPFDPDGPWINDQVPVE